MSKLIIRPETEDDYRNTETLTREAFLERLSPRLHGALCAALLPERPGLRSRSWTLSWCWTAR